MVRDQMIKNLGLSVVFLSLVAACGDIGGSNQCGGAEETGSCLRVEKIVPKYDGKETSNVDTILDICNSFEVNATTTPVKPVVEKFKDHGAEITISNRPLQDVQVTDISDITLVKYAIVYSLNRCPSGAICPGIPEQIVAPGQTTLIPANGSATFGLPFVPLAAKDAYNKAAGSKFDYPSYTATYTLTGTDSFANPVSVAGSAEFTIGNYDYCSS